MTSVRWYNTEKLPKLVTVNMNIKKLLPSFLAAVVFVCVIMALCILRMNGSTKTPARNTDSTDTPHISDKNVNHVFHSGELRGVWVPYFSIAGEYGEDEGLTQEQFKSQFDDIVKTAKQNGANTLFVHVRSHCDAAYPSKIFPFAKMYKKGGKDPDYDPLEYMVTAAHKAGLEFHAWINPYRISDSETELPDDSPCKKWLESGSRSVIEYDGGLYLNPASSDVRSLIIGGVKELVSNYDVDGVHLDDYFYAFTESGVDENDYRAYLDSVSPSKTPLTLEKWRCANVSVLVAGLYAAVKDIDDQTLFGISPQGNPDNDIAIGADVYTWCSDSGYVDYIAPQIYFNSENAVCPYESTVDNWRKLVKNDDIRLYIGLALYKAGSDEDDGTWLNSDDILASQVKYARFRNADGWILYAYDYLEAEQTAAEMENLAQVR